MQTHSMRRVGVCTSLPGLLQTLAMLLVALTMLVWAQGALAHASLIASTPTAGAVLPQAPATVRLTFNEPVSPLVLKIVQPDGSVGLLTSASAASTLISAHIHTDGAMADLSLASATRGQAATLTLYLSKADLTPLVAQEVDVAFSNAQAGVEPIAFLAQHASDGIWQVTGIELPSVPSWHIRIDALISDFERISLETELTIEER